MRAVFGAALKMSIVGATWLAMVACSQGDAAMDDADAIDSGATPADSPESDEPGISGAAADAWGLEGSIAVQGTAVLTGASSLVLVLRGAAGAEDAGMEECQLAVVITEASDVVDPAPGLEGLTTWWDLIFEPGLEAACSWPGDQALRLGFGPIDVQLRPAAAAAGITLDDALGLYGQALDGSDASVFGVALRTGDLPTDPDEPTDGDAAAPDTATPAPVVVDGVYGLTTLFAVPFADVP